MKINKQNKNGKEVSITYGDDNSINVNVFNNKILMGIVGSFDNNLKELEKISGSKIYFRGNSIASLTFLFLSLSPLIVIELPLK